MMTEDQNNLAVILEQLSNLKDDLAEAKKTEKQNMEEIKVALKGLDARLYTLELNDANYRAGFDAKLTQSCVKLGEHDGVLAESKTDRKDIREAISTHNTRISKLEWSLNLLWVAAALIAGGVITSIVGGIIAKLLGWF